MAQGVLGSGYSSVSPSTHWEIEPTLLEKVPRTGPLEIQKVYEGRLVGVHYSALGQVAASWAEFEATVDAWLFDFAKIEQEIGVCFTGQMIGPRPRIDAFISLVRHLGANEAWNAKLEKLSSDAIGLGEQRNRVLHDVWNLKNAEEPLRHEATARRKVRLLDIHVPTTELLRLVGTIIEFTQRFDEEIAQQIFDELHASPDRRPPIPSR